MKKVSIGLCVIAAFLLGFITTAFAAESKNEGYSPGMKARDRRDEKGTEEIY